MSRKGNGWDNAAMERFFLNLKQERVWRRDYANQAEAEKDITGYIVGFYNSRRYIPNWATCLPMPTHAARQPDNLSPCPLKLDHYTPPQKKPAKFV